MVVVRANGALGFRCLHNGCLNYHWKELRAKFEPMAGEFLHVAQPNCYRCPFKLSYPDCGMFCLDFLRQSVKTTTAGKLALTLREHGRKPLLVAADMQRPAAVEQLRLSTFADQQTLLESLLAPAVPPAPCAGCSALASSSATLSLSSRSCDR